MYHNLRSKTAVSLLNKCGTGISYDRVTTICNTLTKAVSHNITEYGGYVLPGLLLNKRIRASLDNIDKKVDTPDGKDSFHGTALAVYQRSGQGETLVKQVQFNGQSPSSEALNEVPPTVVKLLACTIEGNPKPRMSPHYSNNKMGVNDDHYRRSQTNDIGWMMARFFNRPTIQEPGVVDTSAEDDNESKITTSIIEEVQPVPLWSAYNSLAQVPMPKEAPTAVDNVFWLPIIKAPAHEWQTLVTSLDQLY